MSGGRPRGDRGSVTIVGLGCCLALLLLGGIVIDLWRVLGARRELAAVAEASALGGADGIDPDHLRATGEVILDPTIAELMARRVVAEQATALALKGPPRVSVDDHEVTVWLVSSVELGVIRIVLGPGEIEVEVESSARPRAAD
ncbi:MAG: hypothetical protein GY929_21980 [Actinomycetia bacterium]|nr:hypothetical protein [Actinomycetes bacterium]